MGRIAKLYFNSIAAASAPGFNGVGDENAIRTALAEGANSYLPVGTGGRFNNVGSTMTLANDSNRTTPSLGLVEGNAFAPADPYWDLWFSGDPNSIGSNLNQWSLRMLISIPTPGGNGFNSGIVAGYQTGTQKWKLDRYGGGFNGWGFPGLGNASPVTNVSGVYRLELQCDVTQSPALIARLYAGNGTTQTGLATATPSASGAAINMLRFGDFSGTNGGAQWSFAEIEVWNTRNADGAFTNDWSTGTGGARNTSYAGGRNTTTYSIPSQYSTPSDSVTVSGGFTSYTAQGYGNFSRTVDVYIPNGTPPSPSGWPLVMWAHSGYFVSGTLSDLITHWRNRLLNAGYAVASVRYLKSTLTSGTYASYGTANADSDSFPAYARYPSHIVDYKLAAARIRDKYSQTGTSPLTNNNGYGIDATKIVATGYSAGGYIALGAALTRDLTNDGAGRNLTIAGNSSYRTLEDNSTAYTGTDPVFKGVFVYGAPTSMNTAVNNDWTHNKTNAILWPALYPTQLPTNQTNAGVMHAASRAFMGSNVSASTPSGSGFTATDIANLIAKQQAANPSYLAIPVAYVRGTADYIIDSSHETALASATSGTSITYTSLTSPANHDRLDEVYDFAALESFLTSVMGSSVALSGSSAGSSTTVGTLSATLAISGSSAGTATTSGSLTAQVALTGASAGTATMTGSLVQTVGLTGSSSGTAATTGQLQAVLALAGTTAGSSTTVGVLSAGLALTGSSAGESTTTGVLGTLVFLGSGSSVGISQTTATGLDNTVQLTGVSAGVGTTVTLQSSSDTYRRPAESIVVGVGRVSSPVRGPRRLFPIILRRRR